MAVVTPEQAAVGAIIAQGRDDPVWFIETVLRSPLWATQAEIIRAVFARPRARVVVKACHASGKTYAAARLVLAFFYLYPQCRILTTAPTWTGVKKLLWSEVAAAFQRVPPNMGGELMETELRAGRDWFAIGLSTDQGVRFQGHHAEHMLIVLDEAPGVAADIWEAIDGIRAGGNVRVLALGNPVERQGPFYDAFANADAGWDRFTIDAFDTPNLAGLTLEDLLKLPPHDLDASPNPYLVTRRWVHDQYFEWGADNPLWQGRVRGDFPDNLDTGVVPLSWVRACQRLEQDWTPAQLLPVELGMDVGAGGDETVLRERRGVVAGRSWRKRTPNWADAVAFVLDAIAETGATRVKVDSIGIGWGVVGRLQELRSEGRHAAEIIAVNVGEASTAPEKFPKLRDQLWWEIGRELSRSQAWDLAAVDDTTVAQVIAPTYSRDSAGRIKVEPKADTRKRLKRSPDDADALLLAFYVPPVTRAPLVAPAGLTQTSQWRR